MNAIRPDRILGHTIGFPLPDAPPLHALDWKRRDELTGLPICSGCERPISDEDWAAGPCLGRTQNRPDGAVNAEPAVTTKPAKEAAMAEENVAPFHVNEHRHHHNVPPEIFDEIPAEPYKLSTGWAKRIDVKVDGPDEVRLVFFRRKESR